MIMKIKNLLTVMFFCVLGMLALPVKSQTLNEGTFKIGRTLGLIDAFYVDSVNLNSLTEKTIIYLLKELDPHSTYITAKDVKDMNEPLQGNFEGIGIQFNVLHDTIIVVEPLSGGPSEKVGLHAGDRIITINAENVAGKGLGTSGVRSRLMGPKGTTVNLTVIRKGEKAPLDFSIIRDKIPIYSLDAAYMLDGETGYVKLNKFAMTTNKEFSDAVTPLKKAGMKNIIIDLRGNGGGVMDAATELANHFFTGQRLLVYMSGRSTPRTDFKSAGNGDLAGSRVIILTDEGSASSSEIFTGALQDWDRAVVMGRRSFGKGLVQRGYYLTDGSMIRLTVARYYTPTGRSIQSPYNEGYDKYFSNFYKRFSDGEMVSADSAHFPDSLKYKTLINKRTVYGGGGIMPDMFVAVDTTYYSDYYRSLIRKNIFNSFLLEYSDKNRNSIRAKFPTFESFNSGFSFSDAEVKAFISKGEDAGVKFDEKQFKVSEKEILLIMKAILASNYWQSNEYFRIINQNDELIPQALKLISNPVEYNRILGNQK
jgi:carboxyl-terminal processing protease